MYISVEAHSTMEDSFLETDEPNEVILYISKELFDNIEKLTLLAREHDIYKISEYSSDPIWVNNEDSTLNTGGYVDENGKYEPDTAITHESPINTDDMYLPSMDASMLHVYQDGFSFSSETRHGDILFKTSKVPSSLIGIDDEIKAENVIGIEL